MTWRFRGMTCYETDMSCFHKRNKVAAAFGKHGKTGTAARKLTQYVLLGCKKYQQ